MRFLMLLLVLLFCPRPALAQVIAIKAGAVIDPAGGSLARDQWILVSGGKISAVGADLAIPSGARTASRPDLPPTSSPLRGIRWRTSRLCGRSFV